MHDRLGNKIRLLQIIEAINEVETYIQNSDLESFVAKFYDV